MTQAQFDAGVAAERARVLSIVAQNGADARALQFALNTCDAPVRVAPFTDPPPAGDDEVALGIATERLRIVTLLQSFRALHDPAATIAAIESGD